MVLLRRVIGDALRARRQGQHRTLREVSSAANVSLGYLSEIERGQKEPSSELLAAICDALGARLSELLREVSDTVALAEQMPDVLVTPDGAPERLAARGAARGASERESRVPALAGAGGGGAADAVEQPAARTDASPQKAAANLHRVATDGKVAVSVRQDSPLKATLRTTRLVRPTDTDRNRDVVCVA
ncbi:helix-turn-helix transcriptional regulator [Micromonospora sp. NPDC049559]|uniref:helix-turn-helix domain-containing protein n=1 Tax=Micromonospora sp. NPDC049559 TaxID=3155923 RepID=UPI0034480D9C